jgi:hypothetical protein
MKELIKLKLKLVKDLLGVIDYKNKENAKEEINFQIESIDRQLDLCEIIKWIPIKGNLPKNVTPVLVYSECCDVCSYMQIAEIEDGKWFVSGTGIDLNIQPTHWAKLPNPPFISSS